MSKKYLLVFVFALLSVQPNTQNIVVKKEVKNDSLQPPTVEILERKTDSLIADVKELETIEKQKEAAKKELQRLNRKIRDKEVLKQLKKYNNKAY